MHAIVPTKNVHDPQETDTLPHEQELGFRPARPPALALRAMNPVVSLLLRSPLHPVLSRRVMVLQMTGRRTGKRVFVPIGRYQRSDGTFLVSAGGRWRHNLKGGANVQVVLDGRRRAAHAVLEEDPQRVAKLFLELLDQVGERALALKFSGEPPKTVEQLHPLLHNLLKHGGVALLSLRD
jgi:hypothetical protein